MGNEYIEELKVAEELQPENYDGSYELVRETVKQYQQISLENVGYADIDLIFFMTVGSWAYGIEKRKELIEQSCLDKPKKDYLKALLDKIMNNALNGKYSHREYADKVSVGMFGCGFRTFKGTCDMDTVKRFISLVVNVSRISNEDEILDYLEKELQAEYKGIGIASFSQVFHCLRPYVFPIVNGNMRKRIGYLLEIRNRNR